jgi:hypothetical protein
MNHSSRFGSGGVGSSEVLSEDGERVFRGRWRHDAEYGRIWSRPSEELADLPLATEAAGRDRVGLTLGSV